MHLIWQQAYNQLHCPYLPSNWYTVLFAESPRIRPSILRAALPPALSLLLQKQLTPSDSRNGLVCVHKSDIEKCFKLDQLPFEFEAVDELNGKVHKLTLVFYDSGSYRLKPLKKFLVENKLDQGDAVQLSIQVRACLLWWLPTLYF